MCRTQGRGTVCTQKMGCPGSPGASPSLALCRLGDILLPGELWLCPNTSSSTPPLLAGLVILLTLNCRIFWSLSPLSTGVRLWSH